MPYPQFHFIMLSAGEVLKTKPTVRAENMQEYLSNDEYFATKVPLEDCKLALQMLCDSGLLERFSHNAYGLKVKDAH